MLNRLLAPALAYTLTVFALGFVLGTLRVLIVAPRFGPTPAVLLELPIMLAASFLIARWAVRRWHVPAQTGPRALMGVLAFALLMLCELAVSLTLFGNSLSEHLAGYTQARAWPGLAAQAVFAAMPCLLLLQVPSRQT